MDHAKLDSMYQSIAQTVMEMIPEEWTKVYVYGERMDGVQSNYFYYQMKNPCKFLIFPSCSKWTRKSSKNGWINSMIRLKTCGMSFNKAVMSRGPRS
ncbi:DUF600 family protein [Polycladomyces sp. WAk]|uniref:DUF600 family protein n=1 Tax=Polycladomyces zharkentensis TaxID=2807616 RepID=A0ABS2WKZ1_9BACL|nr:DUF600 family protein [Polycladomyces sp. WAk]